VLLRGGQVMACAAPVKSGYFVNNMKYLIKLWPCIGRPERKSERSWTLDLLSMTAVLAALVLPVAPAAQAPSATPQAGLINPAGAEFNPATGKVYVVDAEKGIVNISDDRAGKAVSVKVGGGPVSVAVDSANGRAYVANADDGTVSVLDGRTDAVLATLTVGSHPYSIAADSAAGKIYITRTYSDELMVIDAATNQVTSIKAGSPDLIAVAQDTHTVYLLGYEGGNLAILNAATRGFIHTSVGMHAWGIALNEATGAVYVARPGNAEVIMIESGGSNQKSIPTGRIPCFVAVNARTNTIYVANYADNSVTAIDGAKGRPVATVPVGKRPEALAIDTEHNRVYVANTLGNSVTVIDGATNRVVAILDAGKAPYALALNPRASKLHVANLNIRSFTILDVGP
jgi:YVTN family beta-propeller protein